MLQLPEFNFQVAAQYSRPSDNSLNGISIKSFLKENHVENYQALGTLSWEADIWGRIRSQQEAALAEYMQSYEAVKAVQTRVVADIAQGYFNLVMLDRKLAISKSNLLLSDSFLVATQKMKDAGMVNLLAVQQAESQKQSTSLLIPQLEENIAIQENALKILTGQIPDSVERNGMLDGMMKYENISSGVPASLLSRRPDVRAAELAVVAANARMGVAKANMYPALNITAGGGLESFKSSNWFKLPGSLFGLAAGTITQPVFRRNELKTNYEIAKLEREQSVLEFRQLVLQAVGEVADALVEIEQLQQQRQIADNLHIAARRLREQPVARQARNADDEADDRRKNDAEAGDQKRVEQPDPKGATIGRAARRIFDQRLTDVEAGGLVPESEAGCDLRPRQVVDCVAGGAVDEQRDHGAENKLIGNAADFRVVVEHDTRGARLRRQVTRHFPLVGRLKRRRHLFERGRGRTSAANSSAARSADRRRVLDAALGPQLVQPAFDLER